MYRFCLLFLVVFGWSFEQLVFSIDGQVFDLRDLYLKYSRNEWESSGVSQKKTILNDYLKREGVALEALNLGYGSNPGVLARLFQIEKQFLINLFYEHRVAGPLISSALLDLAKGYVKKEFFVRHILISHNESSLQNSVDRGVDDAFVLSMALVDSLNSGLAGFDSLALTHSSDPSVSLNRGVLGWIQWGRFVNEFQSAVFNSESLGFLGPIETKYGYHVVSVDSVRASAFSVDPVGVVEHEAFSRCLPLVYEQLKPSAAAFDSLVLNDNLFNINSSAVDALFGALEKQGVVGGPLNLSSFLLETGDPPFVLFSFQGASFGPVWLGNQLAGVPPSRIPVVSSQEDFVNLIKLFVLKDFAYNQSVALGYLDNDYFSRVVGLEKKRVLYDYYLRDLINNVSPPDSSLVAQYYEKEKGSKYYKKDLVLIKRLKVFNRTLADSLSVVLEKNPGLFDLLVDSYGEYGVDGGGLMGPFERGKYNFIGESAFSLNVGEVSSLVESLDKSFSFIRVEKYFPITYIPLEHVYKKIESLLLRNMQTSARDFVLNGVAERHVVIWGDGFGEFFN